MALEACGVSQRGAQMGFTQSDAADEDDVGIVLDECQAEKVLDLKSIDFIGPVPVELLQRLDDGKAGKLDAPGDGAVLSQMGLPVDESAQVVDMAELLLGGGLGFGLVVFQDRGQLQVVELFAQFAVIAFLHAHGRILLVVR
jgi:hypothetical protein